MFYSPLFWQGGLIDPGEERRAHMPARLQPARPAAAWFFYSESPVPRSPRSHTAHGTNPILCRLDLKPSLPPSLTQENPFIPTLRTKPPLLFRLDAYMELSAASPNRILSPEDIDDLCRDIQESTLHHPLIELRAR